MQIALVSIFPALFDPFIRESLIGRSVEKEILSFRTFNPRDFAAPPHFHVDDTPYGGGPGMVMRPEPMTAAVEEAKRWSPEARVIYPTPGGTLFSQEKARELAHTQSLVFLCGRYEGIDERIIDLVVDEEISLGDYILMGGEIASMAIIESLARLLPGVLGNHESSLNESFSRADHFLESPHYTKPREFRGLGVPGELLSGDHEKVAAWRDAQSQMRTKNRRPDVDGK